MCLTISGQSFSFIIRGTGWPLWFAGLLFSAASLPFLTVSSQSHQILSFSLFFQLLLLLRFFTWAITDSGFFHIILSPCWSCLAFEGRSPATAKCIYYDGDYTHVTYTSFPSVSVSNVQNDETLPAAAAIASINFIGKEKKPTNQPVGGWGKKFQSTHR